MRSYIASCEIAVTASIKTMPTLYFNHIRRGHYKKKAARRS